MKRMKSIWMLMLVFVCSVCCVFSVIADDSQKSRKKNLY